MADIELVIKIPENIVEGAKSSPNYYPTYHFEKIWKAIVNGTPLPKGHGRLIDADKLKDDTQTMTEWNGDVFRCVTERTIDLAPTIIEADKAERTE